MSRPSKPRPRAGEGGAAATAWRSRSTAASRVGSRGRSGGRDGGGRVGWGRRPVGPALDRGAGRGERQDGDGRARPAGHGPARRRDVRHSFMANLLRLAPGGGECPGGCRLRDARAVAQRRSRPRAEVARRAKPCEKAEPTGTTSAYPTCLRLARRPAGGPCYDRRVVMAPTDASVLPRVRAGDGFGARLRDVLALGGAGRCPGDLDPPRPGHRDHRYRRSPVAPVDRHQPLAVIVGGMSFLFGGSSTRKAGDTSSTSRSGRCSGGPHLLLFRRRRLCVSRRNPTSADPPGTQVLRPPLHRREPRHLLLGLPVYVAVALIYRPCDASLPWGPRRLRVRGGRLRRHSAIMATCPWLSGTCRRLRLDVQIAYPLLTPIASTRSTPAATRPRRAFCSRPWTRSTYLLEIVRRPVARGRPRPAVDCRER